MPATAFDCACAFEGRGKCYWGSGAGGLLFEDEACEEEPAGEEVEAAAVDESASLLA